MYHSSDRDIQARLSELGISCNTARPLPDIIQARDIRSGMVTDEQKYTVVQETEPFPAFGHGQTTNILNVRFFPWRSLPRAGCVMTRETLNASTRPRDMTVQIPVNGAARSRHLLEDLSMLIDP